MKKMIARLVLLGTVLILSVACSTESTEVVESDLVSTDSTPINQPNHLGSFLKGEWLEVGIGCNDKGKDCETPEEPSVWLFGEAEVTWNGFTHPYIEKPDTLLIAGSPYCIIGDLADTIILHAVSTKQFAKLVRR